MVIIPIFLETIVSGCCIVLIFPLVYHLQVTIKSPSRYHVTIAMTHDSPQLCFAPKVQKRKKKAGPAHLQCVNVRYDGYGPDRAHIPLQKISWIKSFPGYLPSQV